MFDVVCCGELLIDFVSLRRGVDLARAPAFKKAPGGAPANVAVGVARLGGSSAFIGQVGDDDFGRFLAASLAENGVDTRGVRFTSEARTALAFVSLRPDGERDFLFYRHPSADMLWQPDTATLELAASCRVFHFGSISLIAEPSRSSTLQAVQRARAAGALISYDPNLRLALWPSPKAAREGILLGWSQAHVVKVNEDELVFLAGSGDPSAVIERLWHPALRLLAVTRGARGCAYTTPEHQGEFPGFPVRVVDSTGAGDGFVAGLLVGLLESRLQFTREAIERALRLANAAGALTCMRRGAIPALPRRGRVRALLRRHGLS